MSNHHNMTDEEMYALSIESDIEAGVYPRVWGAGWDDLRNWLGELATIEERKLSLSESTDWDITIAELKLDDDGLRVWLCGWDTEDLDGGECVALERLDESGRWQSADMARSDPWDEHYYDHFDEGEEAEAEIAQLRALWERTKFVAWSAGLALGVCEGDEP